MAASSAARPPLDHDVPPCSPGTAFWLKKPLIQSRVRKAFPKISSAPSLRRQGRPGCGGKPTAAPVAPSPAASGFRGCSALRQRLENMRRERICMRLRGGEVEGRHGEPALAEEAALHEGGGEMQPSDRHAGIDQSSESGGRKTGQHMTRQKPAPMFVQHGAAGQARPRALRAPPGERAHPLSVPGRPGALAQQHRGKVVPVVERQVPFRVDERVGGIGDEQNLVAGDQRFADRGGELRRDEDIGLLCARGVVRPADRREQA